MSKGKLFFMKFKQILNLGFLVGGIVLFGNPIVSYAVEYEQKFVKGWGDTNENYANQIIRSSDGGFVIVGDDYKNGGFVLKINKEFEEEWIRYIDVGNFGILSSVMEQDGILVIGGVIHKKNYGCNFVWGS